MVESGGRVRRDKLQFVHDKLANAPVGVEAREREEQCSSGTDLCKDCRISGWSGTT